MVTDSQQARAVARLTVPGMGSDHCAGIVKISLKRLDSVGEITANIATHRVNDRRDRHDCEFIISNRQLTLTQTGETECR
ncbi:cation transporter [Marinimicrobium sp. C2-29]|uniref:cation transporter n=1 Tax=Marinimicrobium sp. C2-29 TaxID=3139825 RepID=UPI0040534F89